jgi:uncharacterized damage-inducible protein DinB
MPGVTARSEPPLAGDERATLVGFLDYHRATLAGKCEGLDAEKLARRAVAPSTLSLLGLVRHLAEVERSWLRGFAGEATEPIYYTAEQPDLDFDGAVARDDVVERAFADWRAEIARADEIIAAAPLDQTYVRTGRNGAETFSLRWILTHLVEEYARHNGHADLLRERIDGVTGE